MLYNMLGALIGFSLVMLLLSLIVTSLSQTTQHYLRLRGHNLRNGLAHIIKERLKYNKKESFEYSDKVLTSFEADPIYGKSVYSTTPFATLLGPKISWIENDNLKKGLADAFKNKEVDIESIISDFNRGEKALSKRFSNMMNIVNFIYAIIIAFVFQVSATQLLISLSEDEERREQLVSFAESHKEELKTEVDKSSSNIPDYSQAVQRLSKEYPDISNMLKGLNLKTEYFTDLSEELADKIEYHEDLENIIFKFENYLEDDIQKLIDNKIESAKNHTGSLAALDITPFRDNNFYKEPKNIIGALMSAILIMLGAPFWYNSMSTILGLRDVMKPKEQQNDKQ